MWILDVAYFVVPSLFGAMGIALVLMRRAWTPRTVWLVGSVAVALLVSGISAILDGIFEHRLPVSSLVKAFATLYYLPFLVATSVAFVARARVRSRALGVGLVVGCLLVATVAATYASEYFFALVNARG